MDYTPYPYAIWGHRISLNTVAIGGICVCVRGNIVERAQAKFKLRCSLCYLTGACFSHVDVPLLLRSIIPGHTFIITDPHFQCGPSHVVQLAEPLRDFRAATGSRSARPAGMLLKSRAPHSMNQHVLNGFAIRSAPTFVSECGRQSLRGCASLEVCRTWPLLHRCPQNIPTNIQFLYFSSRKLSRTRRGRNVGAFVANARILQPRHEPMLIPCPPYSAPYPRFHANSLVMLNLGIIYRV